MDVTAKVAFEKRMEYQGEGIVLYAEHVEVCEPLADEMVYFTDTIRAFVCLKA